MQQDKRTVKTEKAIREAFFSLLRKKSIEQVTVNDICEAAMISRNTFYGHYADKYLLLETLSKEFILQILNKVIFAGTRIAYQNAIHTAAWAFFQHLDENKEMLQILSRNDPHFWPIFSSEMQEFMLTFSGASNRLRVFTAYSASALTGCYRDYFEGKLPMSPEKFVQCIIEIAEKTNTFMVKT